MLKIFSFIGNVGKLWEPVRKFIDGKKTYGLGTLGIVQGAVGILMDLSQITNVVKLVEFATALTGNDDWKMVVAGFGLMFLKSAAKKAEPKTDDADEDKDSDEKALLGGA